MSDDTLEAKGRRRPARRMALEALGEKLQDLSLPVRELCDRAVGFRSSRALEVRMAQQLDDLVDRHQRLARPQPAHAVDHVVAAVVPPPTRPATLAGRSASRYVC